MTLAAVIAVTFLPYFESRNTIANYIIDPPGEDAPEVSTERPSLVVRDKCTACDGKGELNLEEPDYGQDGKRLGGPKKTKKKCPVCGGRKKTEAYINPATLAMDVARDREKFCSDHQAKGEIAVGSAFVPRDKYEKLDRAKQKLVREAYGDPCRTCNWTGLEQCRKCKGQGTIPCPNDDCKGGWAVTSTTTSYQKSSSGGNIGGYRSHTSSSSRRVSKKQTKTNVQICPDCGGANVVTCPDCGGRRAAPCKRCGGTGIKQKGSAL